MEAKILEYFKQLSKIPRESWNEEGVRKRLISRSKQRWYTYTIDTIWNLIIYVPATLWNEKNSVTILQAHMDMVCVKDSWVQHDFAHDPIQRKIVDGRIQAHWTTLGADNGIGLCMILASCDEEHGALELYFTVDEEVWLTGALHTQPELFEGTSLINLDTEELWEICISSAWWCRLDIQLPVVRIDATLPQYEITLAWLVGWHSGTEIDKQRGNAHRILHTLLSKYDEALEIISLSWWFADNAIPATSKATVGFANKKHFSEFIQRQCTLLKKQVNHESIDIRIEPVPSHEPVIAYRKEYIHRITTLPIGIQVMSQEISNFVQTSLNRWIIQTTNENILLSGMLRSSNETELQTLIDDCKKHIRELWTATVRNRNPWWEQDPNSTLVTTAQAIYQNVLWSRGHVEVKWVHAWLECGAIVANFDRDIDSISFGPTIRDAHSPDEKCRVESIWITYELLKQLLVK